MPFLSSRFLLNVFIYVPGLDADWPRGWRVILSSMFCRAASGNHMKDMGHECPLARSGGEAFHSDAVKPFDGFGRKNFGGRAVGLDARQQISHELGHERAKVTAVYLGR
jgi:hypothetical protein